MLLTRDAQANVSEAVLAKQSAQLVFERIPSDVVDTAVDCFIDTLGASIASGSEGVVHIAEQITGDAGICSRLSDGAEVSARSAALANGISAHVLDFDDWLAASGVHPSAPLLPAVLAAAQARGPFTLGSHALLTAFVAGFESQARIGAAMAPQHYASGFHPTATVGVFGAATGVSRLLCADENGIQRAWGLSAAQAAGLRAEFGTMGKSFQVGRAAEAGLLSAQFAAAGATAPMDAIFGPRGLAATYGHGADIDTATVPFDQRWYLRETLFKRHAACFGTHAAVDVLLSLRDELAVDQVSEIELTVPELVRTVCAIPTPTTPLEGKFSLAFTAALALVRGSCGINDFSVESVNDPELAMMTQRVRLVYDETLRPQQTHVRVVLHGGDDPSRRFRRAHGVSASSGLRVRMRS